MNVINFCRFAEPVGAATVLKMSLRIVIPVTRLNGDGVNDGIDGTLSSRMLRQLKPFVWTLPTSKRHPLLYGRHPDRNAKGRTVGSKDLELATVVPITPRQTAFRKSVGRCNVKCPVMSWRVKAHLVAGADRQGALGITTCPEREHAGSAQPPRFWWPTTKRRSISKSVKSSSRRSTLTVSKVLIFVGDLGTTTSTMMFDQTTR